MGLLPGANFQQGEEFVAPGDLLVAFSDGVVEATNLTARNSAISAFSRSFEELLGLLGLGYSQCDSRASEGLSPEIRQSATTRP